MTKPPGRHEPTKSFRGPARTRLPSLGRLLRTLLPVLLAATTAGAQTTAAPVIGPPPDWVEVAAWTAPTQLETNPTGQDFLLLDDQARLATGESYHRHAFQIVTDSGRSHGSQVYINFDPSFQTLTIHHLQLVRNGETSSRLDPAKIQVIQQERDLDRQLYNGERSALVILDDVRIGDIIDVAYTLHGRNPVFDGRFIDSFYLEWGTPVRDLRYRLLVPEDRRVTSRQIPPPRAPAAAILPAHRALADRRELELTWRRTGIPIVESEDRVPDSHHVFSFVDVTEFPSWESVVEWARPLYALDPQPHAQLDATVAELKARGTTPEQRVLAALDFVQREIRYLGIEMGPGSHRPSAPEEVLRRRFGDCKDKTRLLTALLQRLDLPAFPALVHSARREAVRERLPSPYAFDHVIVALDLGGRRYLLDPTMSYQRGDRLELRHVGTYGPYLRVAPGTTGLEESALGAGDESSTTIVWNYQVSQLEQPAEATVTTTAQGRAATSLRAYFATRTLEQIGREYLDYYTRYHPGISQRRPVEHRDQPATNTYTVTEHYRIERLFAREGSLLRAQFDPATIWEYVRPPNLTQRKFPYALSFPAQVRETIQVNLPETWTIEARQETVSDPAFAATFHALNPSPQTVRLDYTWTARAFHVDVPRLGEFSANMEKARNLLGYQLTWNTAVSTTTAGGAAFFPPNWPMLALAAGIMLAGGWLAVQLARRPNPSPPAPPLLAAAPPADPYSRQARTAAAEAEGLGGWLILVAVGLCLRPVMILVTIIQAKDGYFNASVWQLLSTPGSEHHQPNFTLVAPLELILNFTLFTYAIFLPVLFFRRSHLFPRAIQIFLGLCVLVALFGVWSNTLLGQNDPQLQMETTKLLVQTVIGAAIWIPYFSMSRRVRRTFVR
jgi:transglutaminase-like putative cysteine protease